MAESENFLSKTADLNVLIVDDNASMRKLLRTLISSLGVKNIAEANDGAQAFKKMLETPFDLVITDWKMQPVDGIELAQKIRALPDEIQATTPIILATAFTSKELILSARDAGIHEVLAKPLSLNMIKIKIASILDRPRVFIRTPNFNGPDRRRGANKVFDGTDRRGSKSKASVPSS